MNRVKTLGLFACRSPLAIGAAITSVALCGMVTCLECLWRLRMPVIFSMLPEEYRRIMLLVSGMRSLVPVV